MQRPPVPALIALVVALAAGSVAWWAFDRAADVGVARLQRIDAMRALCTTAYAAARNESDTMRIDRSALPDTIDPSSKDRIDRCGVFRAQDMVTQPANARKDITR